MNTATQIGIAAVNQSKQKNVEIVAVGLINAITGNLTTIKSYDAIIKAEQEKMAALALDVVTQGLVMGAEMTGTLNANQVTIAAAIAKVNEGRQESVSFQSQSIINKIEAYNSTKKNLNIQIAEWRKQLSELVVDVVDAATVVGE